MYPSWKFKFKLLWLCKKNYVKYWDEREKNIFIAGTGQMNTVSGNLNLLKLLRKLEIYYHHDPVKYLLDIHGKDSLFYCRYARLTMLIIDLSGNERNIYFHYLMKGS